MNVPTERVKMAVVQHMTAGIVVPPAEVERALPPKQIGTILVVEHTRWAFAVGMVLMMRKRAVARATWVVPLVV